MISTRKLLSFIDKNPNCSYEDVAKNLFQNDIQIASNELLNNQDYLSGWGTFYQTSGGAAHKTLTNISLNSFGKQYLEDKFNEKWRFRIPLIISAVALIISLATAYFTYLQI